ncbi:MAG: thioredoxin [Clostridia bacterium]|nr:thioredoxin [Clostridia bacterium]
MVQDMNKASFEAAVAAGKPLVVDFYADWCGPCKMLAPIVEQAADAYPQVTFGRVNVDAVPELAMMFGIQSIPLVILFQDGKRVNDLLGYRPYDELAAAVEELL